MSVKVGIFSGVSSDNKINLQEIGRTVLFYLEGVSDDLGHKVAVVLLLGYNDVEKEMCWENRKDYLSEMTDI